MSLQDELDLLNCQIVFMKSSCYSLLIILSLIGFINMANTMITSTVTIALILGNIFGYAAFDFCRENGVVGLFTYHLPLPELVCFVLGVFGLQGILAFILSKNIQKKSLIERIRQEE